MDADSTIMALFPFLLLSQVAKMEIWVATNVCVCGHVCAFS